MLKNKEIPIEQIENNLKSLSGKTKKTYSNKRYVTNSYSDKPISFEKMLRNNRK
jgi:hypothetical protein